MYFGDEHSYFLQLNQTAQKISEKEGILSVSIHVGNSDSCFGVCLRKQRRYGIDIIGKIKELEDVDRVLWSEEIVKLPSHKENIMKSFNKYWNKDNY